MSVTRTSNVRRSEHFEPDTEMDPHAQRKLRGQLEQIDYTAYASNKEIIASTLGSANAHKFQMLGIAAAQARTRWVASALAATASGKVPTVSQIDELAHLRTTFEELTEVYEAMRRMVERGYLAYAGS